MRGKVARILRKHSAFKPHDNRMYCQEEMDINGINIPMGTMYECCNGEDGKVSFNTTRRIYKILKKKWTNKGV